MASLGINFTMFLVAYILQTDKLTDISYSLTFALLSAFGFVFYSGKDMVDILALVLILVWAFRLGSYLFMRIHKIGRDKRFDNIRINFKSFFLFWLMQGLTVAIVLIPFMLLISDTEKPLDSIPVVCILISATGLILETIADQQKYRFKLNNANQFMNSGVWRFIRHPNYTGELMFWFGIGLLSAHYMNGSYILLSLSGPIWISYIIIRFSGIPPLEKTWKDKYSDNSEFKEYWNKSWRLIPFIY